MNSWYTVRRIPKGYWVVKFDFLLNVECVYNVEGSLSRGYGCDCFRGYRSVCRHREMVYKFEDTGRVDKGFFYCYDKEEWALPVTYEYQRLKHQRMERAT